MNVIKKLKQLFCRHMIEEKIENQLSLYSDIRLNIKLKYCIKCDFLFERKVLDWIRLRNDKNNFSIVKGMAESARLYKQYFNHYIDFYRLDYYSKCLYYKYVCDVTGGCHKKIKLKYQAEADAQDFIAIQDRIEMEKKEEFRKLQVNIDLCHLGLPHV